MLPLDKFMTHLNGRLSNAEKLALCEFRMSNDIHNYIERPFIEIHIPIYDNTPSILRSENKYEPPANYVLSLPRYKFSRCIGYPLWLMRRYLNMTIFPCWSDDMEDSYYLWFKSEKDAIFFERVLNNKEI